MRDIKFFVDSCNPADTQQAIKILGVVSGQTTNPTLLTKTPEIQKYLSQGKRIKGTELLRLYKEAIRNIGLYVDGAISVEVYADWNTSANEMLAQAHSMQEWGNNIYVKFPTIPEGLKAADEFTQSGGHANMTLVFDQSQAAAVYSATRQTQGTAFVSPFVGRWDDRGFYGLDLVQNIKKTYDAFDLQTHSSSCHVEILAASIRSLDHVHGSIALGADIITAPISMLQAWVDAGSNKSPPIPAKSANARHLEYQTLTYNEDFATYSIDKSEDGLLSQGLTQFVLDWKSVVE
ncbi:transaldolase [Candidatus Woesebacteria bacterium]|nr:transaldolase [Candidatus Woesebacteria bacterium]